MTITVPRLVRYVGLAVLVVVVYWAAEFVMTFELFGYPVRNSSHGWLGPTPRDRRCMVDIGKVHEWTCEDITPFQRHWFGCWLWLRLNGLNAA